MKVEGAAQTPPHEKPQGAAGGPQKPADLDFARVLKIAEDNQRLAVHALVSAAGNPLAPMEPKDILGMVQAMTGPELQVAQVQMLGKMGDSLRSLERMQAGQHVGKYVEFAGGDFSIEDPGALGAVAAPAPVVLAYRIPDGGVSQAMIRVLSGAGEVVRELEAKTTGGHHHFEFDGTAADGTFLAPGSYQFQVMASTPQGPQEIQVSVIDRLLGVEVQEGGAFSFRRTGGLSAPLEACRAFLSTTK